MHKIKHSLKFPNVKQLFATCSTRGILYGSQKIRKSDFSSKSQFRPTIFAAYNTPSFKLARSLVHILSPLATNDYTVDSTHHSFVSSLKNVSNADKLFMASFDIENLFSNIQVSETINIISDKLFFDDNLNVVGLAKKSCKSLLDITVFIFLNSILYKQIESWAWGNL